MRYFIIKLIISHITEIQEFLNKKQALINRENKTIKNFQVLKINAIIK